MHTFNAQKWEKWRRSGNLTTPVFSAVRYEKRNINQMSSNPNNMFIDAIGYNHKIKWQH